MHLLFLTQNLIPCSISNHSAYKSMFFYKLMGNTKCLVGTKFIVRSKPVSHRLSFSSIIHRLPLRPLSTPLTHREKHKYLPVVLGPLRH